MRGNHLIFSASGDRRKLFRVNPLFFPQYEIINGYFLPEEHELPQHGLTTQMIPFDYGFNDPTLIIAPYDSVPFAVTPGQDFLAEAITATMDVPGGATPPAAGALANILQSPAFLINFQHTHNGSTRQWANKGITSNEACGTGEHPLLFKSPVLIPKGDTLTCTVQNMLNASLRVQVLLLGGSFD
jgi:hypothetical protein